MTIERAIEPGVTASTVADAAAGDAAALAGIVAAHHDDMARLCFVICGDADLAQDAVQAAWPLAWRRLGTLRDPDRLRPWLMTIAANEARQLLRRRGRQRVVEIEVVDIGSQRSNPAELAPLLDLRSALGQLTPDERAMLAMRHLAGFDSAEIGAALGISPEAVRARLSRLVARLRVELSDD